MTGHDHSVCEMCQLESVQASDLWEKIMLVVAAVAGYCIGLVLVDLVASRLSRRES